MALGNVLPDAEYYSLTLIADERGRISRSTQTHFVGWADDRRSIELRAPSLVSTKQMIDLWESFSQAYVIVNTAPQLRTYLGMLGGHALVRRELAVHLPRFLDRSPSVKEGVFNGFTGSSEALARAKRRHPAPRHRMNVLKRDMYRCRICGRTADDGVDIRLHVHHIRDYARGGPTLDWNLITLCQTCHEGLDEGDYAGSLHLYRHTGALEVSDAVDDTNGYYEGVRRFRASMGLELSKASTPKARRRRRP